MSGWIRSPWKFSSAFVERPRDREVGIVFRDMVAPGFRRLIVAPKKQTELEFGCGTERGGKKKNSPLAEQEASVHSFSHIC